MTLWWEKKKGKPKGPVLPHPALWRQWKIFPSRSSNRKRRTFFSSSLSHSPTVDEISPLSLHLSLSKQTETPVLIQSIPVRLSLSISDHSFLVSFRSPKCRFSVHCRTSLPPPITPPRYPFFLLPFFSRSICAYPSRERL